MMKKKLSLRALTRQVARLACIPLIALSFFSLISCSNDDDESDKVTEYALSDLYGYTFQGKISASSGNTLTPQLVIYDEKHLSWNMNTSGMNDSAFFYTAEQTKTNVYSLSWYSSESDFNAKTNSGMTVTLGINSATSVTVLVVSNSTEGTSGGMAGKPVPMTRTNEAKKTWTESGSSESGNDSAIPEIAVEGESAEWAEESSVYTGKMKVLVSGSNYGNDDALTTTVTKTSENTVTVTNPATSAGMGSSAFDIEGISVTKSGDVYYLSKKDFTLTVGTTTYTCDSFTGKLEDGILTFVFVYTPGAMPMSITEVFTSTK